MAAPAKTYSFASGSTISAAQFNTNFDDIFNGVSDGTKDIAVNNATFAGTVDCNGALKVAGAATFSSTVDIVGAIKFGGATTFSGAVYADSTVRFAGATTFSGTVDVAGAFTASSTARFANAATFSAAVYTDSTLRNTAGATFLAAVAVNSLTVSNAATFSSTVQMAGALTASSTARFADATTFSSTVDVAGAFTASSTARFSGAATFSAGVNVQSVSFASGTLNYASGSTSVLILVHGGANEGCTAIVDYQKIGSFIIANLRFSGITAYGAAITSGSEIAFNVYGTALTSVLAPLTGVVQNIEIPAPVISAAGFAYTDTRPILKLAGNLGNVWSIGRASFSTGIGQMEMTYVTSYTTGDWVIFPNMTITYYAD